MLVLSSKSQGAVIVAQPPRGADVAQTERVNNRLRGLVFALLGVWAAALVGGCAELRALVPNGKQGEMGDSNLAHTIAAAELDELTRAFADRYVGLISSTCDALKKNNPDAVQRREAQELMLDCATNVYDIASNADAYTRMLDLVVVTTLLSQV